MATFTFKDASLTLNSVDLSAYVQSVDFSRSKDTPEATAMGDNSMEYLADGMKNATFSVTFRGDYTAGTVEPTLSTAYDASAVVPFVLLPNGASPSTSNPSFSGNCIVTDYGPVSGSVGDTSAIAATFQVSGDVTRATA